MVTAGAVKGAGFFFGEIVEQRHVELAIIAKHLLLAGRDGGLPMAALLAEEAHAPPRVVEVLKAGVGVGTISDSAWAGPLAAYRPIIAAFVESLRSQSIFYRI